VCLAFTFTLADLKSAVAVAANGRALSSDAPCASVSVSIDFFAVGFCIVVQFRGKSWKFTLVCNFLNFAWTAFLPSVGACDRTARSRHYLAKTLHNEHDEEKENNHSLKKNTKKQPRSI